ncbi:MAG: hypothetical protein V3U33_02335 [candidate division NC10 bacterium]
MAKKKAKKKTKPKARKKTRPKARKKTRPKARKKTKAKARKKTKAPKSKKPFGGYSVSFKGRKETLESVFGSEPIGPAVMTKKLWTFVKRRKLGKRR